MGGAFTALIPSASEEEVVVLEERLEESIIELQTNI